MKKTAVLLILLLVASSVAFAASNYVRLSPAGVRFDMVGGPEGDDFYYDAGFSYTGYFWGGEKGTDSEEQVRIPGQWASTSGYVPRRYIIVQTVTESEPARPAGKTMGLQLAIDGTADIDAIRSLYDDEYEFDMDMLGWQAHAGFAMRQFLTPSMYVYENVGVSAGSWLLGGYADVGFAVDLGSFSVNLGAKADAGAYVALDDLDFDNADLAVTVTPYFGLGFGF